MNTTDLASDRVFSEVKRLCYSGLDSAMLRQRVLERLKSVVPFDGYVDFTMDPSSGLVTHALAEEMGDERGLRTFLEHVYFEDDVLEFNWMVRNRLPVGLLSETTGGEPERALRFRELIGPAGFGFEMRGAISMGADLWGGLCLTRQMGSRDFDSSEVAFMRRIIPHLGAGLRAATLQLNPGDDRKSDDATGVLVFDHRGTLIQQNAAAERRLRELDDLDAQWHEGRGLPIPIWAILGALERTLKPETDRDLNSSPHLHVRGHSGRWLTLQASLGEACSGRSRESIVIIAPTGPKEVLHMNAIGYGLSAREHDVVDLAVRGASTRQISETLFISEYTVKDHLSNIFGKVGVRGRRELVKRLYLNTILS